VTLVLFAANLTYTVIVADGRLVSGSDPFDDGFPKTVVLSCPDARIGVAFSGLANAPGFRMSLWLPDALLELAAVDRDPNRIIEGVRDRLDDAFAGLPSSVTTDQKRTALLFAGYTYNGAGNARMFHRGLFNHRYSKPGSGAFVVDRDEEKERYNYAAAIGAFKLVPEERVKELSKLINAHKPSRAVVDKTVEVVQEVARRKEARGRVGGQCSSLVIPSDRSLGPSAGYHPEELSDRVFLPGSVAVDEHGRGSAVAQAAIVSGEVDSKRVREMQSEGMGKKRRRTTRGRPIAFPKVGRNAPCPCGSGQKYKRCHGQNR